MESSHLCLGHRRRWQHWPRSHRHLHRHVVLHVTHVVSTYSRGECHQKAVFDTRTSWWNTQVPWLASNHWQFVLTVLFCGTKLVTVVVLVHVNWRWQPCRPWDFWYTKPTKLTLQNLKLAASLQILSIHFPFYKHWTELPILENTLNYT